MIGHVGRVIRVSGNVNLAVMAILLLLPPCMNAHDDPEFGFAERGGPPMFVSAPLEKFPEWLGAAENPSTE